MKVNIKRITFIPTFTSLMIVFTIILPPFTVPIINVNITLQTFIVMLAGLLLSPFEAFLSIFLYVLIGIVGFPVFSGMRGGVGVIFGPSGGFIVSFPIVALLISVFRLKKAFILYLILTLLFGIILTYLFGLIWLYIFTNNAFGKLIYGILIFIPFDILKCILASFISIRINNSNIFK